MNNSVALPRIKTKKKRRKPPGPWLIVWGGMLIWDIAWIVYDTMRVAGGHHTKLIALGFMVVFTQIHWWLFKPEWDKWRDDD